MKVNVLEHLGNNRDIVGMVIIHATTLMQKPEFEKFLNVYGAVGAANNNLHDVVLTIDGVEIPFVECVQDMARQFDANVAAEAKRIVKEIMGEKLEKVEELTNEIADQLRRVLEGMIKTEEKIP